MLVAIAEVVGIGDREGRSRFLRLPAKIVGRDFWTRLPAEIAGLNCRPRLPDEIAGRDCWPTLVAKITEIVDSAEMADTAKLSRWPRSSAEITHIAEITGQDWRDCLDYRSGRDCRHRLPPEIDSRYGRSRLPVQIARRDCRSRLPAEIVEIAVFVGRDWPH